MALFGKKNEGGLLDVIRCDEETYLIWKWRPAGADANESKKENAIRWDSSLRVKDGEAAVFVYKQKDGAMQDFIEGPFDDTIKTANFPVLSSIVGLAFGGGSPFQNDFGVLVSAVDIAAVEADKESEGCRPSRRRRFRLLEEQHEN
jgi:membrane protease subunit (stomatin/prohibitin family)